MKVALLIYGHMRTYTQCFPFLRANLLGSLQPDVFLHTWDETEPRTRTWHNRQGDAAPLDAAKVRATYQPVDMIVETQPPVSDRRVTPNNNLSYHGQKFMLESLQKACALKRQYEAEHYFDYDVVMKIRPDIKLLDPFELRVPETRRIVHIAGNRRPGGEHTACDILNVAMSNTMNSICNAYDHFDRFYVQNFNEGQFIHSGFVDYLLSLGLRPVFLEYLYGESWTIGRGKK